jgi:hypothetical protein
MIKMLHKARDNTQVELSSRIVTLARDASSAEAFGGRNYEAIPKWLKRDVTRKEEKDFFGGILTEVTQYLKDNPVNRKRVHPNNATYRSYMTSAIKVFYRAYRMLIKDFE